MSGPSKHGNAGGVRSSIASLLSPEKIPLGDYRLRELVPALSLSAAVELPLLGLRATTRELPQQGPPVAPRAIVSMLHEDIYLSALAPAFWASLGDDFAYLAFHGFASYVGMIWPCVSGYHAFRYRRGTGVKPLAQTLAFLRTHPRPLRAPHFRRRRSVRKSPRIARRSRRRHGAAPSSSSGSLTDRSVRFRGHTLALPRARILSRASRAPSSRPELAALGRDGGRELLQRLCDDLRERPVR